MHESEPIKGLEERENSTAPDEPSTESKIIISLLMRIYDVQMAMLSHMSKDTADRLYEAHENGEDYNPTIFIPEIKNQSL